MAAPADIEGMVARMQATDMGLAGVAQRGAEVDEIHQRLMYPHGQHGSAGPRLGIPARDWADDVAEAPDADYGLGDSAAGDLVLLIIGYVLGIASGVWLAGIAAQLGM